MTHIGPLEQEIMDIIWAGQCLNVREVLVRLQTHRKIAYTTVMTILGRLTEKGLLTKEKDGRCFKYSAKTTQALTLKSLVKQTLANFVDQYGQQAVAAFLDEVDQLQTHENPKRKRP